MASSIPIRKDLFGIAKLNLRGQGILLKKLHPKLLMAATYQNNRSTSRNNNNNNNNNNNSSSNRLSAAERRYINNARVKKSTNYLKGLKIIDAIRGWGRGGLEGSYLEELTKGMPWVASPTFLVAFKYKYPVRTRVRGRAARNNSGGNNSRGTFEPAGFIVYGTFKEKRKVESFPPYSVQITGVNNTTSQSKVAEIEGVITSSDDAVGKGVGRALVEYALADVLQRTRNGAPVFNKVVLLTDQHRMKVVASSYGFEPKEYIYTRNGTNATSTVVSEGRDKVDDPRLNTAPKYYVFNATNDNIKKAYDEAVDRVVPITVCPPSGAYTKEDGARNWYMCR